MLTMVELISFLSMRFSFYKWLKGKDALTPLRVRVVIYRVKIIYAIGFKIFT